MYQANDTVPESIDREPSARRHQSTCKVLSIYVVILGKFHRLKKYFFLDSSRTQFNFGWTLVIEFLSHIKHLSKSIKLQHQSTDFSMG